MTGSQVRSENVRRYILERVEQSPESVAAAVREKFGISRQAVNRHLQRLCREGILERSGHTRARRYRLVTLSSWSKAFLLEPALAEDVVWSQDVSEVLSGLERNASEIWHYGFTEIFNNAIDHSEGSVIHVSVSRTALAGDISIADNGCGIFKKITRGLELVDERHAVLELSKGKFTTDPQRHTGEGIFFASKMFDQFHIVSGGACFSNAADEVEEWLWEQLDSAVGTSVYMKLRNETGRTTKEVFDRFVSGDDYAVTETVVPVRAVRHGDEQLVSRSQAKRLMARVEQFKTVRLDFIRIDDIGPAFADEIFRVFKLRHPEVELVAINTNADIERTIGRARRRAGGSTA